MNEKDRERTVFMGIYNNDRSRSKYRFCIWYMQQNLTNAPITITAKHIKINNKESIHRFQSSQSSGGSMSQVVVLPNTHTILSLIQRGFAPSFVNYKNGALDPQPQVIMFTSCLPMVGGSLWILRLFPPLKLVAIIQLKY